MTLDEPKEVVYWVDPLLKQINRASWTGHKMETFKTVAVSAGLL